MGMATKAAKKKKGGTRRSVHYLVNAQGKRTAVLLPIALYKRMLEQLEDAEDIRDAEEVMKNPQFVPWEEAERQLDALSD
jgi:hypothetical protein